MIMTSISEDLQNKQEIPKWVYDERYMYCEYYTIQKSESKILEKIKKLFV